MNFTHRQKRKTIKINNRTLALLLLVALSVTGMNSINAPFSYADSPGEPLPKFTIEALLEANLSTFNQTNGGQPSGSQSFGLGVSTIDGESAFVDRSLLNDDGSGIISASSSHFVDISWSQTPGVKEYNILKNDELLVTISDSSFRDINVNPGDLISYRIDPIRDDSISEDEDLPIFGVTVTVPDASSTTELTTHLSAALAAATDPYLMSTVRWTTFIPEARVDAPPIGCEYGNGYEFGGDDRGFGDSTGFRTEVWGVVLWDPDSSRVGESSLTIGSTKVYNKSTGELAKERTLQASDSSFEFRELGSEAGRIDLRISFQAGNPFCTSAIVKNSIAGAMTLSLTHTGSFMLISGEHKLMPNHEIKLSGKPRPTTIYQREHGGALCLVNLACPLAQMGGITGTY